MELSDDEQESKKDDSKFYVELQHETVYLKAIRRIGRGYGENTAGDLEFSIILYDFMNEETHIYYNDERFRNEEYQNLIQKMAVIKVKIV